MTDHIAELGFLSLGSRFKRLSDSLYQEMAHFYGLQNITFDPGNFPLIHYISAHGTPSVGAAASHLGISQAAVSQKAATLAKAGLIKFVSDKSDRRKSGITLTAKGSTLVEVLKPSWDMVRTAVRDQLGEEGKPLLRALEAFETGINRGELRDRLKKSLQQHNLQIVPFDKKNAPMFDKLNRYWIEEYFSIEPFDNKVLTNPKKMIIDNGGEVWFAELNGEIVGACALMMLQPGLFEFTKLGVLEKARGKGVARALLHHCIERARQHGHPKLRIFTSTKLAAANALYRSEGFVEIQMSPAQKKRYSRADIMYDLLLK